uniref:Uncharacterized protein n=1 Tax=Cacopsylla melanoneura TaxID=428564 RepID=A0A8D9F419_9HEMI
MLGNGPSVGTKRSSTARTVHTTINAVSVEASQGQYRASNYVYSCSAQTPAALETNFFVSGVLSLCVPQQRLRSPKMLKSLKPKPQQRPRSLKKSKKLNPRLQLYLRTRRSRFLRRQRPNFLPNQRNPKQNPKSEPKRPSLHQLHQVNLHQELRP